MPYPETGVKEKRNQRKVKETTVCLFDRAVPHTPTKCRDKYLFQIGRIWNHPMSPLEIEARNPRPMFSTIGRAPRRALKAARVQRVRPSRIYRHVVDVLDLLQHVPPGPAPIR